MPLYDQHLHSWHSFDSETDPVDNCVAAVYSGLKGITFTEHFDTHPEDWKTCRYDEDKIRQSIAALRERFSDRLFVGKGIEVCYQPDLMDGIRSFLASNYFDMVMLSIHWAGGRPVQEEAGWKQNWRARTRQYLNTVLEAVRECHRLATVGERPFDVLGHLDLAKRYSARYCGAYDLEACEKVVDDILRECVAADLAIEINTSTLRTGLDEPMPSAWVLHKYVQFGGRRVTLGSDAHVPEHIGADFKTAAQMLSAAGLSRYCVFRNRHATFEPLQTAARTAAS
jgi:histidinol-phosphatase (PHP family)